MRGKNLLNQGEHPSSKRVGVKNTIQSKSKSIPFSPNLFLVGFQRCGSSSLFHYLNRHSQIQGAVPKETFFLCDPAYDNFNPDQNIRNQHSSWHSYFPGKKVKYQFEASVCNFYQRTALKYIGEQENSKVIFILRDPVERFVSTYKYYSTAHKLHRFSLQEYFQKVKGQTFSFDKLNYAVEHGKYHKYLKIWQDQLGKERIHIVGLKQLVKNPQKTLHTLLDFLELRHEDLGEPKVENYSRALRFPVFQQILIDNFKGKGLLPEFAKKWHRKWFTKKHDALKVPEDLKNNLMEIYKIEYDLYYPWF